MASQPPTTATGVISRPGLDCISAVFAIGNQTYTLTAQTAVPVPDFRSYNALLRYNDESELRDGERLFEGTVGPSEFLFNVDRGAAITGRLDGTVLPAVSVAGTCSWSTS